MQIFLNKKIIGFKSIIYGYCKAGLLNLRHRTAINAAQQILLKFKVLKYIY